MRTKKQIMENVWDKCNCDTLEQMQNGLMVEILVDMRDEQVAHNNRIEQILQGGQFASRSGGK